MSKEKLYVRYDLQDETDSHIETLEEMKSWLVRFWCMNPDDDMEDEEFDQLIEGIWKSDEYELQDRMQGIDYCFDDIEEEVKEHERKSEQRQENASTTDV